MINSKKILAIILARGGSKRLPGKNIKLFCGKPLIAWTIEAAKKSHYIDNVIVSTDSREIAEVSEKYGAKIPFLRPSALAKDTTTSEETLSHTLNSLDEEYDYFLCLQPTSPLRAAVHIDEALEFFEEKKEAHTLVSLTKCDKNPYWIHKINEQGFIESYFDSSDTFPPMLEPLYMPNGAIYIGRVKTFMEERKMYTKETIAYIMDKAYSIDIDDNTDFLVAEHLHENEV